MVQHLHNRQTRVDSNEISELERAHGHVCSVLHDTVYIFLGADARLEANDCFVDVRHEDAVCEEARRVCGFGRDFSHFLAKGEGGFEGGLRGLEAGYYFYAFLDGYRVHEVGADDARRGGEVRGIGGGTCCDFGDGDGGRVCCEDGVGGADLGELGEDFVLEVWDFGNGFDDEVDVREVGELRAGCKALAYGYGIFF